MSTINEASAFADIATKVSAQRLAISFLASAVGELVDEAGRKRLQERLSRWADEAEMRGADDLYEETASVLRLMAARVGEAVPRS